MSQVSYPVDPLFETFLYRYKTLTFPLSSIGLKTLQIEHVSLNCTSCWLLIARKNSLKISGQCFNNRTIRYLNSLTDKQLEYTCSKSSIDCSIDYCEPGSIIHEQKLFSLTRTSPKIITRTMAFILGMIALIIIMIFTIVIIRWKKNFCCHSPSQTATTIAEATRRRREHHKQIIDSNPVVIESVVTHGANMNVPSYPHDDENSKNKRKLYNPMFADSPTSDTRQQQSVMVSNDSTSHSNYLYSEHL